MLCVSFACHPAGAKGEQPACLELNTVLQRNHPDARDGVMSVGLVPGKAGMWVIWCGGMHLAPGV